MFVFGYGSLAALPGAVPAVLRDHRRTWGVAMDNRVVIPGYKVYTDAAGVRPAVCVAFLDVEPAPGAVVRGACLEVDGEALTRLDARERSYARKDVSGLVDGPRGPVFTYRGRPEPRRCAAASRANGTLVVQRAYLELVRGALGAVEDPGCPVLPLVRHDLDGGSGA